MSGERLLAHGPGLEDLSDFLCFDRIIYPVTMAYIRPLTLAPGYAGYPLREPLMRDVRDQLTEARLIVAPGTLAIPPAGEGLVAQLANGVDAMAAWIQQSALEVVAVLGKIALSTLETPASDSDVTAWQRSLDANVKTLADAAVKRGYRAVGKFHLEDVTWTLKPGWSRVLSLTFRRFPRLRPAHVAIDEIIGFLADEGTRQRRQRLFDWHAGIEAEAESDRAQLGHVSDRLVALYEDYRDWIKGSGLCAGTCTVELLMMFGESFVNRFIEAGLPKELDQELLLGWRGLAAANVDSCALGREVGYISHGKRRFKRLWPG